jgi:hypothetical protein
MFWAKYLCNKFFEIEAEIAGVAGDYAQNRQRKYQEYYSKDLTTACLRLVLHLGTFHLTLKTPKPDIHRALV